MYPETIVISTSATQHLISSVHVRIKKRWVLFLGFLGATTLRPSAVADPGSQKQKTDRISDEILSRMLHLRPYITKFSGGACSWTTLEHIIASCAVYKFLQKLARPPPPPRLSIPGSATALNMKECICHFVKSVFHLGFRRGMAPPIIGGTLSFTPGTQLTRMGISNTHPRQLRVQAESVKHVNIASYNQNTQAVIRYCVIGVSA